jgi:hypothetical protein
MSEILNVYAEKLEKYDKVNEQGDGIRSFVGILLYLMIDRYCTFLIDEPESFLHPPQANIMGKLIAESLDNNQQAFISTHSEEILKGLLEIAPERVKIIRIERNENKNYLHILDNSKVKEIWNDPLLKYSNIMSGLFHNNVVVCESDSDCKMYSAINNELNRENGKYSETLFVYANGKHRIAKIVSALKSLNVQVKAIVDIDVFKEEITFEKLVSSFNINYETEIKSKYHCIESNLSNEKSEIERKNIEKLLKKISENTSKNLTNDEIKDIEKSIKKESKWEKLKKYGTSGTIKGDAVIAFKTLNEILEDNGIFIVSVGEIENFITEVGGHGPEWVDKVLEKYPNFNDKVYNNIKTFVSKLKI